LYTVEIIREPGDVVLFEILADLDLDHLERDLAGIGKAVPRGGRNERAFALPEVDGPVADDHIGHSAHDDPVLAPVVMHLQGESLAGVYRHPLDPEEPRTFKLGIGAPGPVHLEMVVGDRIAPVAESLHKFADLLGHIHVAGQERITSIHQHKVTNSYERCPFPGSMYKVTL